MATRARMQLLEQLRCKARAGAAGAVLYCTVHDEKATGADLCIGNFYFSFYIGRTPARSGGVATVCLARGLQPATSASTFFTFPFFPAHVKHHFLFIFPSFCFLPHEHLKESLHMIQ